MNKLDKDTLIDHQILLVHREIAHKLIEQPDLIEQVEEKLEQRFAQGLVYYGVYISWQGIIELKEDVHHLAQQLCENTKEMNKLRRNSPFVGLLSDSELEKLYASQEPIEN